MTSSPDPFFLQKSLQTLGKINSLILKAGDQPEIVALEFFILNETAGLLPYDRAALFSPEGTSLLGVSGTSDPDCNSHFSDLRKRVLRDLGRIEKPVILQESEFNAAENFQLCREENGGTSILLLPLVYQNECVAFLWLERWQGRKWVAAEMVLLGSLCDGYAKFWHWIARKRPSLISLVRSKITKKRLIISGVVFAVLLLFPLPLRVAAPCEIVPENPVGITTRIDGVIDKVLVRPGDQVKSGDILARFDQNVIAEELKEARQQAAMYEKQLLRIHAEAFKNPSSKGALAITMAQLEQAKARLELAVFYSRQSTVLAPTGGTVVMGDPHEWEGRPVRVGERLMLLVDPQQSKVRIELPQDDVVDFPEDAAVRVLLNARSADTGNAVLSYVANHAQADNTGKVYFMAEAKWQKGKPSVRMGLRGTAVVYGNTVPLGYVLIRKPLVWLRNVAGW